MAPKTTPQTFIEGCEDPIKITQKLAALAGKLKEACAKHVAKILTVAAFSMGAASPALAQKTDTPLAVSASASSAKDVLTMASNGDKFDEFLKKYGDKSLDEAEKRLELPKGDPRRWEEKDFDRFAKYRKETNIAIKNQNQGEIKTGEAVINQTKENDMKIAETARKAFPIYEATLNKNGSLQGISSEAKGLIRYVAQFKIPPELAEKAENMLKYI